MEDTEPTWDRRPRDWTDNSDGYRYCNCRNENRDDTHLATVRMKPSPSLAGGADSNPARRWSASSGDPLRTHEHDDRNQSHVRGVMPQRLRRVTDR